ncbi:MAG: hypothetical protein AAGG68_22185 [Bacteroidota bacterium]
MKKGIGIVVLLFLMSFAGHAQKDQTIFNEGGIRLTGAWGGPYVGGTLIDGKIARQSGGMFGLEFNKNLVLGWGGNSVDYPSLDGASIDFSYSGLFLNYMPSAQKAVHPSFGILAGGGHFGAAAQNNKSKNDIWVGQPFAGVEFNLFRWCRVGVMGGYRFAFFVGEDFPNISTDDLSAPYGALTFKFGFSWGDL